MYLTQMVMAEVDTIKCYTNNGDEVILEFLNVAYLKKYELASRILSTETNNVKASMIWNHAIAELSVSSPKEYLNSPKKMWTDLTEESIGKIHKLVRKRFVIQDFFSMVMGEPETNTENNAS